MDERRYTGPKTVEGIMAWVREIQLENIESRLQPYRAEVARLGLSDELQKRVLSEIADVMIEDADKRFVDVGLKVGAIFEGSDH